MTTPVLDDLSTVDPAPTGRLDVAALRMLRAIDDAGTITGAATLLGLSQPAVSQHVRRLERRLGTALLDRSGRSVRLTEAGAVLARHGSTVTAALRAAEAEVASLTGLRAGRVRLVGFPSAAASLVPRALAALRQEHPGLTVALDEAEPPQSLQLLRSGRCDLALTFEYPGVDRDPAQDDRAGLVSTRLLDDPTYVALPAAHPAAATPSLDLADLADERWIAGCPRAAGTCSPTPPAAGSCPRSSTPRTTTWRCSPSSGPASVSRCCPGWCGRPPTVTRGWCSGRHAVSPGGPCTP